MMEEIIDLEERERVERQYGDFNITEMASKSLFKCSNSELRFTGIIDQEAKIRVRSGNVIIDKDSDFFGILIVKNGSIIIKGILPGEARLVADSITLSDRHSLKRAQSL